MGTSFGYPISIFCSAVLDGVAKLHSLVEGSYSPLIDFSVTTCPKWHGPCSTFRHELLKSTCKIAKNSLTSVSNLMPTVDLHMAQAPLYKLLFHAKLLVGNAPDDMALTRLTNKSICCTCHEADMNPSNCGFNAIFRTSLLLMKHISAVLHIVLLFFFLITVVMGGAHHE